MFLGMGPMELIIILAIALLIFGPKNLPKLGKSLGQTVKNVREGMEGDESEPKQMTEKAVEAEVEHVAAPAPAETVSAPEDEDINVLEDVVFCSKCGAKNSADDAFCSKCGAKLATE